MSCRGVAMALPRLGARALAEVSELAGRPAERDDALDRRNGRADRTRPGSRPDAAADDSERASRRSSRDAAPRRRSPRPSEAARADRPRSPRRAPRTPHRRGRRRTSRRSASPRTASRRQARARCPRRPCRQARPRAAGADAGARSRPRRRPSAESTPRSLRPHRRATRGIARRTPSDTAARHKSRNRSGSCGSMQRALHLARVGGVSMTATRRPAIVVTVAVTLLFATSGGASTGREGGTFRVVEGGLASTIDPALVELSAGNPDPRPCVRRARRVPGQAASSGPPGRARSRREPPENLAEPQDVHVPDPQGRAVLERQGR